MSQQYVYSPEQEEAFFDQIDQVFTLSASSEFEEAEKLLLALEDSIPDPKEECSVGDILLETIFSFYEQAGQIEKALPFYLNETSFLEEKLAGGPILNPVHFITTGSIYYALEDLNNARKYFKIAYSIEGEELFEDLNTDFLHLAIISDEEFELLKKDFVPAAADQEAVELSDEQQLLIDDYCEKGNLEMDRENYSEAIAWFRKASDVLPDPKWDWEASGWLSASIGDAYFSDARYEEAIAALAEAEHIYGDEPNPFVLLRLGEAYFELGDLIHASAYLLRAYKIEGAALFEDDKKYLSFLKKQEKL